MYALIFIQGRRSLCGQGSLCGHELSGLEGSAFTVEDSQGNCIIADMQLFQGI